MRDHVIEDGLDPDHRPCGGEHAGHLPLNRAARTFAYAYGHAGLIRAVGCGGFGDRDIEHDLSSTVGGAAFDIVTDRSGALVEKAELVARKIFQCAFGVEANQAISHQTRAGRTKEVARVDSQRRRVAGAQRRVGQGQIKINAFRQEILNQHALAGKHRRVRVGLDVQRPRPTRGRGCDRHFKHMSTCTIARGQMARVFHPVGSAQDSRQRQTGYGIGQRITGERGGIDDLARAIGSAIRGEEHINRRGGRAAFDPAIREIKSRIGQRQESQIGLALLGDHEGRGGTCGAANETRIKATVPHSISDRAAQLIIGARQECQFHPFQSRCAPERLHEDMQPVIAFQRREPKIRQHKPLRRAFAVIDVFLWHTCRQSVDPWRLTGEDVAQRQPRRHGLI